MSKQLCKGGCGNEANYKGWCKLKWKSGNRFGIACPIIEEKKARSISKFRIEESKKGKNPMQNPLICAKNHSIERNKKCSESLKKLGGLKLLPQQIENETLKQKRRENVSKSLKKLFEKGEHPRQLETLGNRKKRLEKMANTLKILGEQGKLPVQNMTKNQKEKFSKKISKTIREGIKSGRIKLSRSWKKVYYKNLILRSCWEREMAKFLDKNKFDWEYETKRISYWDTQRKIRATTIPDFFIPSLNLIIEVKSNAEYDSQNTRDKSNAIVSEGFNFILAGRKEISLINNNEDKFLKLMGVANNEKS